MRAKLDAFCKPFGFHFILSSENTGNFPCNYESSTKRRENRHLSWKFCGLFI